MTGKGLRMTRTGLRFRAAAAREIEQHRERGERGQHPDELRGREDARDDEAPDEVATPDLDDPASDRVEKDVEPEDLSVEGAAPVRPLQDEEDQQGVEREVDLCRVEGDVQRSADRL